MRTVRTPTRSSSPAGRGSADEALDIFASRFVSPVFFSEGGGSVSSQTGAADAFMALSLALAPDASPRIVLAVEPGIPDAGRLADDLAALSQRLSPARLAGLRIYEFPSREEGDKGSAGRRLKAVAAIRA